MISGGSATIRRSPSAAAAFGEPGQRAVAGLAAGAARGPLDLVQGRRIGRGAAQPVEVDPLVGAFQQRLLGQVREVVAVGAHAAGHRVAALRLRRAVLPPRHPDARDQPAHVPLPRPGVRLVEVVQVEDQVPLGGGVEAEVAQVGVTADDGQDAGRRQAREVLGHDRRRTAEEGERRGRHPADPHRHEPRDAALVGDLHEVDGVEPVGGWLPVAQGRARRALPQPSPQRVPLGARRGGVAQRGERRGVRGLEDEVRRRAAGVPVRLHGTQYRRNTRPRTGQARAPRACRGRRCPRR